MNHCEIWYTGDNPMENVWNPSADFGFHIYPDSQCGKEAKLKCDGVWYCAEHYDLWHSIMNGEEIHHHRSVGVNIGETE